MFGERPPVTDNMVLIYQCFFIGTACQAYEISGECLTLDTAVTPVKRWKFRLLSNQTIKSISVIQNDSNGFAGIEIILEVLRGCKLKKYTNLVEFIELEPRRLDRLIKQGTW